LRADLSNYDAYSQLWMAVLQKAVADATSPATPAEASEISEWLRSYNASPGSLIWICDILGIDAEAVREEVFNRKICVPLSEPRRVPHMVLKNMTRNPNGTNQHTQTHLATAGSGCDDLQDLSDT